MSYNSDFEILEVSKPSLPKWFRLVLELGVFASGMGWLFYYLVTSNSYTIWELMVYTLPPFLLLQFIYSKTILRTKVICHVAIDHYEIKTYHNSIRTIDIKELTIRKEVRNDKNFFFSNLQEIDEWEFELKNGKLIFIYVRKYNKSSVPALVLLNHYLGHLNIKVWEYPILE